MKYWLLKSEPSTWSWSDQKKIKTTIITFVFADKPKLRASIADKGNRNDPQHIFYKN